MKPRKAAFFLPLLFSLAFCSPAAAADQTIRVLVIEGQKMLKVNIRGEYVVRVLPTQQVCKKGKGLTNAWFVPTERGVRIGKEEWVCRGVRIEPIEDRDLLIGESRFRGSVTFLKDPANQLYAVNTLGVESYLYGVLHHEVAAWWPMDALKAQAIASRTYALYQMSVSKGAEYDVKSSTSSQVYGGSTTERFRTNRAVDLTRGLVLAYQGKVFPAYFHATCAGKTAAAKELWSIDIPPLAGSVSCAYCRISPHYNWEARVAPADIESKLNKNGRPIGQVLKIAVISQTPSGRAGRLRISGTNGEAVIAAKDFRVWIGGNKMRSTLFRLEMRDDMVYFHGRGWGHGVGLCQWGTLGQSLLGKSYQEILKLYYPSSQILNLSPKAQ